MSLPALPVTADIRSITERVNVLIRDYNSGRVDTLESQVAALLALANADLTVFLGADVALNNTGLLFNGPNTGSIGAAGQKWLIAAAALIDSPAAATTADMGIHDGTTFIASQCDVGPNSFWPGIPILVVVRTLTGPTTYTMKVNANTASGVLRTTGLSGMAPNKATWITAVRLS